MVAGRYQTKPELPFSPGLETAGVIEACGSDVQGLKPGDRVMALLAYGGRGLEPAGVIEACGSDVQGLKPGDRVMAILAYGGLAEYAVAPAAETYVIPQ